MRDTIGLVATRDIAALRAAVRHWPRADLAAAIAAVLRANGYQDEAFRGGVAALAQVLAACLHDEDAPPPPLDPIVIAGV